MKQFVFVGVFLFVLLMWAVADVAYKSGHLEARKEATDLAIKYRCSEGTVFRKEVGYWVDTKQPCKTLEEMR